MAQSYMDRMRGVLTSALGIAILLGTPLIAQADQGKWWTPKQGDSRDERDDRGARDQGWRGTQRGGGAWRGTDRGSWQGQGTWQRQRGGINVRDRLAWDRAYPRDGGSSGSIYYRNRGGFSGRVSWGGGFSGGGFAGWRGVPVRRDVLVIRDRSCGGFFRARRIYCAPRVYGRFVYVRPVRFFIAADACVGPIGIRARIVRPHYLYGCNFCDATFDSYGAYCRHVERCDHRPPGCDISISNWDDGREGWDGPYQTDDSYRDDGGYGDQGSCDDRSYGDDDYDGDNGYYDDAH